MIINLFVKWGFYMGEDMVINIDESFECSIDGVVGMLKEVVLCELGDTP